MEQCKEGESSKFYKNDSPQFKKKHDFPQAVLMRFHDVKASAYWVWKPKKRDNMYSFDIKNIVPKESLTYLVAKATLDESMLWHRRLGYINFKNINKLVKDNLVRGLPTKRFENDQTCVTCLKGKQHRASCKSKVLNPITKPLFMLHMDLFGPTFMSSLMYEKYCLVVIDDYSRFTWVFFLTTKDETSEILKNFIKEIENLVDKKMKTIRSDNGTEFKNKFMDDFCREKGYDAATAASPAVESFVNLTDKSRSDKGYQSVSQPLSGNFIPSKPDLMFIDEIVKSKNMNVITVVTPSNDETVDKGVLNIVEYNIVRRECCASINKELVSDGKKKTVFPTVSKIEFVRPKQPEKLVRKPVKYDEMYRSQRPRGNQRNWNNQKSQQLGKDDLEDPSKQGRKITEIDQDPGISLVQHDVEIHGRHEHEPEFDFDVANVSVTTAGAEISIASPEVKTVGDSIEDIVVKTLVYIRRSAAKEKDKCKANMEESESAITKTKRQQEQERLGFEVAVRLQAELDKEER
ncbi:putative ribonuclease H-like domain-containing protein [Tanacetum coccineum]|uniref:Ribonuclease H-like domain-containing protein n=1 Tax=Tanacetum coccineum TaxID=301880 RepID=A0ABQ5IWF1_9ASTR